MVFRPIYFAESHPQNQEGDLFKKILTLSLLLLYNVKNSSESDRQKISSGDDADGRADLVCSWLRSHRQKQG